MRSGQIGYTEIFPSKQVSTEGQEYLFAARLHFRCHALEESDNIRAHSVAN